MFPSGSGLAVIPRMGITMHRHRSIMRRHHPCTTRRRRRSEEHTSELQSHVKLVCRLLLEKKKAQTNSPIQQGTIAMLGTFIDTIVICTITGLVIVASGAWQFCAPDVEGCVGMSGATLTAAAVATGLPLVGSSIVSLGLAVFAFTTLIGWSFYGEKCTEFLFGVKSVFFFRVTATTEIYTLSLHDALPI